MHRNPWRRRRKGRTCRLNLPYRYHEWSCGSYPSSACPCSVFSRHIYILLCFVAVSMAFYFFWVYVTTGYIPWSKRDTAGYLLIYSVKRTQLIGRRPLSPCRVRKTAGYTLPRLLFSRTVVPRFSEMYPDLAGSGTSIDHFLRTNHFPLPAKDTKTQIFLPGNQHGFLRRAIRSYQRAPKHQLFHF